MTKLQLTDEELIMLIRAISEEGRHSSSNPKLSEVTPFNDYFNDGDLKIDQLDEMDGECTRREILVRYLALCAVVDQGPDILGVHKLVTDVTNQLYDKKINIRFLHTPEVFFKEIGCVVDTITSVHESIKEERSEEWARNNRSTPQKYNLFMDNTKQVLNYAVFRWGVPIALPLLLSQDKTKNKDKSNLLINHLESWDSAETMSQKFKDDHRYGLGKAIGDKACHLFAKWITSTYPLVRSEDKKWGSFSYEVPYDSNAGRILWRTGYFGKWVDDEELIAKKVIQIGQGKLKDNKIKEKDKDQKQEDQQQVKERRNYIRVTNIRGIKIDKSKLFDIGDEKKEYYWERYKEISTDYLHTHDNEPQKVEIQRIQHAFLLNTGYTVADFDDGLMHIGTNYCLNTTETKCEECPLKEWCVGKKDRSLITDYNT